MLSGRLTPTLGRLFRHSSTSPAMGKLLGKTAIVTASTDGIGLAIARRLGQDGAKVVVSSRKQKNVDQAVKELQAENLDVTGLVCHVGKAEDRQKLVDEAIRRYGGIDIFVSNAAANPAFGPMLETTEEAWDKIFDTNVKATFLLIQKIVPHMEKRGGGSVVIVSSIGGYHPFNMIGPYSVSKTSLLGLTKALANECGPKNIRVNGIAPGIIKTRFSESLWKNPNVSELAQSKIPLGRFGEATDCAGTVSFLVGDDSAYITGETIVIAGGTSSRL